MNTRSLLAIPTAAFTATVLAFTALAPAQASDPNSSSQYSVLATQDTYVQGGSSFSANVETNYSTNQGLSTKSNSGNTRISYVEFSYDSDAFDSDGVAELSLFVWSQNEGQDVNTQPVRDDTVASTGEDGVAFLVDVYGIIETGESPAYSTLTFTNTNNTVAPFPSHRSGTTATISPTAAASLGVIRVPGSESITPNTRVTLSSTALRDFLVEDSDQTVSLFFIRRDFLASPNLVFHSLESTSCHGPQLRNFIGDSANTSYSITYAGNGSGATNVPGNGSANHFECATPTVGSAPDRQGFIFDGWDTAADGTGSTYMPGDRYRAPANVTLHALWRAEQSTSSGISSDASPQSLDLPKSKAFEVKGFSKGTAQLTGPMRKLIRSQLASSPSATKVTCRGLAHGDSWSKQKRKLATDRASAGCRLVSKVLPGVPVELKTKIISKGDGNPKVVRIRVQY